MTALYARFRRWCIRRFETSSNKRESLKLYLESFLQSLQVYLLVEAMDLEYCHQTNEYSNVDAQSDEHALRTEMLIRVVIHWYRRRGLMV